MPRRWYSSANEKVVPLPNTGMDSVSEGTVATWHKEPGQQVDVDEVVVTVETDKIALEVRATEAGKFVKALCAPGDVIRVGQDLYVLEVGATGSKDAAPKAAEKPKSEAPKAAEKPAPAAEKPAPAAAKPEAPKPAAPKQEAKPAAAPSAPTPSGAREERRVKMPQIRKRIAQRLKDSQNTAAMLTTFNEIDMFNLMEMRNKYKDVFQKKHGVKLGFMSAFVRASSIALTEYPDVNAVIDDDMIIYRDFQDISVAVASTAGLVVPVIRNAERLSFAQIEKVINELAEKARDRKLAIEDMTGGTFTISNGGVYGSMMGTPIINPPQSAILGMHAINQRPYVVNGEIKIRPIMYVALTYDHRLIDGRGAVLFLKKIKSCIEEPESMLLDI